MQLTERHIEAAVKAAMAVQERQEEQEWEEGADRYWSNPDAGMLHKSTPGLLKSANYDNGTVEAIVSVTMNLDKQGDVIVSGAFKKAIADGKMPTILKRHDWDQWLGVTTDMKELLPGDPALPLKLSSSGWGGLWVRGQFTMEDPAAKAVFAHIKRGAISEFSIGFAVDKDEDGNPLEEQLQSVRYIKSIFPLYEWSVVMRGANPATMPLAAKGDAPAPVIEEIEEIDELEGKARGDRKARKRAKRLRQARIALRTAADRHMAEVKERERRRWVGVGENWRGPIIEPPLAPAKPLVKGVQGDVLDISRNTNVDWQPADDRLLPIYGRDARGRH